METKITIFKNIKETKQPHYITIKTVLERIKSGRSKKIIEAIRSEPDKKKRNVFKSQLPSICFSGIFSQRGNNFCKKHSGLVAIDFDNIENVEEFKESINKDKYTFMSFVSPSGNGLKVIVKIPANIKTHSLSCKALEQYYKSEKLDNFEDIARVCYESYDPDTFVNEKSEIFEILYEEKIVKKEQPKGHEQNYDVIFDNLVVWLEKSEYYTDGNKHKFIVKLAGGCNRFGIPEYITEQKITAKYQNAASFVDKKDFEKIIKKVYTNYKFQNSTSYFEKEGEAYDVIEKTKLKEHFFNEITDTSKDIIYLDNVRNSMIEGFKTGKARGETTYFEDFDYHWKWRKKEVTFVSGIGNMGKSSWFMQLCLIKAVNEGTKFGVFTPEQDPPDDFYNDLIHTYVGKSTEPYHENQMSFKEYTDAMDFVKKHFFYVYPETASPTPEYINNCFATLIKKHGIDACITDPFNQLDTDIKKFGGREDLYISDYLSKEKRFSQDYNVYKIIIGHPVGGKLKKDSNGDYEQPNVYDYAGGSMWHNKCDNILLYHRPYATSQPQNTMCEWISQKIKKRKLVGVPGMVLMNFDVKSNRFLDERGKSPFEKNNQLDISDIEDLPNEFDNNENFM